VNCGSLSNTGLDGLPLLLGALVALCLVVFGIALLTRRRRGGLHAALVVLLLVGAGLGLSTLSAPAAFACAPAPPAPAPNSLTITQTSVLTGLRPGSLPVSIAGTVTNNSDDETSIDDIEVSISAVTLAVGAASGTCTVADFELLDTVMPVDATLAPHATLAFSGASLALVNAPSNQDACQGATVQLLYVTT
jgi:hypothetical protein